MVQEVESLVQPRMSDRDKIVTMPWPSWKVHGRCEDDKFCGTVVSGEWKALLRVLARSPLIPATAA